MEEKIIVVNSLRKTFKDHVVLKDVSFTVDRGSIFSLLGSNGAGKTTVIRILSTLLKADGGFAAISGFNVTTKGENVRNCISLTGQFVALDDVLTGRENLTLIGQLKRLPNLKKTVNEWLTVFDLTEAANQRVSAYSGGMRRRLDIAMSLMGNPKVLFLDEPTTGLDPQSRIAMWSMVKELAYRGTTVFLTTQYLEEAEYLADHIAVLHDGTIIADGTPQSLKEMIPQRGISLYFNNSEKAGAAMKILNNNGIAADSVTQKLPSLETVFLSLIDNR